MDCRLPGFSAYGILQARILEWVSISFSRGSSQPRDGTCISCIGRRILYHWATREAQNYSSVKAIVQKPKQKWVIWSPWVMWGLPFFYHRPESNSRTPSQVRRWPDPMCSRWLQDQNKIHSNWPSRTPPREQRGDIWSFLEQGCPWELSAMAEIFHTLCCPEW